MAIIPILGNLDDLAEAIADPPPNRPFEKAVGEFGQTVCDRFSAVPTAYIPGIIGLLGSVCQPYLDGAGYDSPSEVPPFTGGQCANIQYGVIIQRANGTQQGNTLFARGPLTELSVIQIGTFQYRVTIRGFTSGGNPFTDSTTVNVLGGEGAPTATPYRTDNQPDNCGNPPGVISPGPNPAPDPGPLPPGSGPQIDIRGNPVLVLPPNFSLNPNFEIGFDVGGIKFGSGGGGLSDDPPFPGDTAAGPNGGAGGADDEFGEPPEGERWCGVCIAITYPTPALSPIPGSPPYDVFPTVVGNARLLFSSDAEDGVDTGERILTKDVCLWEPVVGLRPTGVYVNLLPGFTYTRTPYSVPDTN